MTRKPGLIVAAVGVVLAVVLFVILSGGDDGGSSTGDAPAEQSNPAGGYGSGSAAQQEPEPDKPDAAVIEIKGGEPVGGVSELEFASGDEILIEVASDAAYEIHLHGYDISQNVPAGGTVEFKTTASIEGVFELEIEDTVTPIAEISVVPG